MKILVKTDFISKSQSILNIFHVDDEDYIEKWINEYIKQEINNLYPSQEIKNDISYDIESNFTEFSLIQKTKIINKGYIYNSNAFSYTKLFTININNFTETLTDTCISLQKNISLPKMSKISKIINDYRNKSIYKMNSFGFEYIGKGLNPIIINNLETKFNSSRPSNTTVQNYLNLHNIFIEK